VIEAFLASAIFLIATKRGGSTVKAIKLMLNYLRHDANVFAKLSPNRILLRKMNLEKHFFS